MPIYYATNERNKAFMWGVLSGVSEPLGALFCYILLRSADMHPAVYGFLFC